MRLPRNPVLACESNVHDGYVRLSPGRSSSLRASRRGFSFVELIMALLLLSVGVMGFATTTFFTSRQLTLAEVTTARAVALQSVMERIRASPYDSLSVGGDTIGPIVVSWTTTDFTAQIKAIRIVTLGPGQVSISETRSTPMLSSAVADTLIYMVLGP